MSDAREGPPIRPGSAGGDLHQRARQAIRLLLGRQLLIQALAVVGGIVMARVLGPSGLGLYGIALFIITVAGLLADLGTSGALIQQPGQVTDEQLATCFTVQQILVIVVFGVLMVTAPAIAGLYPKAPPDLAFIIRLFAFDLFLRSCRSMSEITLERELRYREFAVSDIVANVGYQIVSIGMVLTGWGVQSLVWGMLVSNVIRIAMLVRVAPWPVRMTLEPQVAWRLIRAGAALQASRAISLAPGWITPTLVAGLIGPEAVGLLAWAASLGRKPLEALENIVRVSATHFARVQHDLTEVERLLTRYVVLSLLACGLWPAVIVAAGEPLVTFVYTAEWLPAMPALILYSALTMVATVRNLASSALTGIGRFRVAARINTAAAVVAVVASVVLVLSLGFIGVPMGQLIGVLVGAPWLLRALGPGVPRNVTAGAAVTLVPLAAGLLGGLVAASVLVSAPTALYGFSVAALVSLVYAITAWVTSPNWLRAAAQEELAHPALGLRARNLPRD